MFACLSINIKITQTIGYILVKRNYREKFSEKNKKVIKLCCIYYKLWLTVNKNE